MPDFHLYYHFMKVKTLCLNLFIIKSLLGDNNEVTIIRVHKIINKHNMKMQN